MEKKVLGKGLSALIPENIFTGTGIRPDEKTDSAGIASLKISQIRPNPFQPRVEFDPVKQQELIASIKEKGFLQPILVRKVSDGFEIIAGERRLRAAKALNMEDIPVLIKEVRDEDALVISIMENIQREEFNAIEEAKAFARLISDFKFTQDYVAQSVGKDRSTVNNILRLLKLPAEIQKSIALGELTMGHARALLGLEDYQAQMKMYRDILAAELSVRAVENLVKSQTKLKKSARKIPGHDKKDPFVAAIEEQLQHRLGTKVRILHQRKRGKIVIEYYSNEDLERIVEIIKK